MGFSFVAIAGICVALGAFLISSSFSTQSFNSMLNINNITSLLAGLMLNLAGCFCWAFGRQQLPSYYSAWLVYLSTLVLAGLAIAILTNKQSVSFEIIIGTVLILCGAFLIGKT